MDEEFLNGSADGEGDDGPPVLPFLPPTDEPSSLALAISVALVGCLTIAICGNASQIVLQIYTRRLTRKIPPQCFIAILLFINFLVPLGLPSVILEKLVRIWMFGRMSCHAHHILTTAGRVVIPWTVAILHAFVAMFLARPSRFTRVEGVLASIAVFGLIALTVAVVIPQGMAAELELIRKDEIDSDQYIMLIHTYRCFLKPELNPVKQLAKFGYEFAVPLILSVYFHLRMDNKTKLKTRAVISRNLASPFNALKFLSKHAYVTTRGTRSGVLNSILDNEAYILVIHYLCNILYYIPEQQRNLMFKVLPEDADLHQLLPFLSPTLIWYPLSQLSAALSRCNSDKIEDDRTRKRVLGRATDTERSQLMKAVLDNERTS
ncbi:unnamed protein product [Heligmosomoides polygyrus]|uniref:G_PROTEIN_RECEP_F1_2 domain-containing protein n=1 Tax=Heligmosomoides polygyrus TaxID=6339 RepID=A0A3P7Z6S9_HELPZ|nr:unnamed protein product [Heligmosomoides polygyrus]